MAVTYTKTLLLPMLLLVLVLLFRMCDITRAASSPIGLGGNEGASVEWDRLQVLETMPSTMLLRQRAPPPSPSPLEKISYPRNTDLFALLGTLRTGV